MATKKARSFVKVTLLEQDEGKFAQGVIQVDSENVEDVKLALSGRGLGPMGCDLPDCCFELVRLTSLESLKRKHPKNASRKRKF